MGGIRGIRGCRKPKFTCRKSNYYSKKRKKARERSLMLEQKKALKGIKDEESGIYTFQTSSGAGKVRVYDYNGYTRKKYIEVVDGIGDVAWMRKSRGFYMPLKAMVHKNVPGAWEVVPGLKRNAWRLIRAFSMAREFIKQ